MAEFKNEWFGGRNSDLDPSRLPPNQYISATNVELVGDGNFAALRNINGTDLVQQLSTSADFKILNAVPNKYLIDDELVDCITIFSVDGTTFSIKAYDCENNTLYSLFSETVPADYATTVKDVDAKTYPENGTDIVYYTDNYLEIRHLKCEIPSPYSANFLSAYDISLLRRGALGTITSTVGSTGTLLSGTYQFSYRMADPTNKRFTKWSTLTNPIHVYSTSNGTAPVYSGIGLITNRKISLTITPSTEETDNFDYLQLAVVESTGATDPINASLLEIEAIAGTSLSYDYKSNSKIGTIPLTDITVDLAQIKTAKTLNIKDNRLFGANITYTALEFDNGTPSITSGSIITQSSGTDGFSSDEFASKYKGYFRGEVYRFGVVYEDKYGNKSPVYPLDLGSVTDNDITPGLTDVKFPDRTNSDYTLFNGSGQIQSLGLRLTGLNNHPSWARKLEIVRVDRKGQFKNILFQSPIIPMSTVHGIGALDQYPNTLTYKGGEDNQRTLENATPMTSGSTLVPKNMFWPEQRSILKSVSPGGSGTSRKIQGEVQLMYVGGSEGYTYSMLFPDQSMYSGSDQTRFQYTGSEKLDFIDYALLKGTITESNPSTKSSAVVTGDDLNTNVTGTFHATADNQYYFNHGHAKAAISPTDRAITDYEFFDSFGTTDTVAGKAVMDYDAFQTGGLDLGFKPNIQRCAVVKIGGSTINDVSATSKSFGAATWNSYTAGGALSSASATLKYESSLTNKYINEYSGFSSSVYVGVVGIVNVKLGLGDDRYGESTDIQEYISTGCKYTFTEAEIATLEGGGDVILGDLDVWGGDCFVSSHTFKISDSSYSVTNQGKNIGSVDTGSVTLSKWNNMLFKELTENEGILCMPVAVENAAQYIQVILESEYNGSVMEQDILDGSSDAIPIMTGSVTTARTPLTYRYNSNLNKNNSQKIFVPEPQFSFKQSEFGARVIYSDLKIYNSDQAGFDIFRVANFYDIEEKYRPITKLALAGNQLYSIHENGVIYLPTGEGQIEQADGGTLAVRSGEVIGKPIIVDSERGGQHLRAIVETGNVIYIADNRNKNVYVLAGQQLQSITKDNETIFRSFFSTVQDHLIGLYDPFRQEYWVGDDSECHVFNEKGFWVSAYTLNLKGSATGNQKLYVIGLNGTDTSIYSAYTGDPGQLCGASVDSDVTFAVNPLPDFSKTFDNLMLTASDRVSGVDFAIIRESSLGNQTASASLDDTSYEGNWRIKNPRDGVGARLRGTWMQATITWKTTQAALKSVWTKYRPSARTPW